MIDISYVILLADKAGNKYYNSLIKRIQDISAHINYEIVIVDVRESTKHIKLDFSNVIYVDAKRNIRQMAGRRLGANYAKGKYIWYIDDDDYPTQVPDISSNADMIIFNVSWYTSERDETLDVPMVSSNVQWVTKPVTANREYVPFGSIYTMGIGYCLWQRLVKADIYRDIYNRLPEDIYDISYAEDVFIVRMLMQRDISIKLVPDRCYNIRAYESTTALEMLNPNNYEETCLLPITGYTKMRQLAIDNLADGAYFTYENLGLFIQKAINSTPVVRKKIIDHLISVEDKDIVFYVAFRHLGPDYTDKVLQLTKEYYQGMSTIEILKRIMKKEVLCGKERYMLSAYC